MWLLGFLHGIIVAHFMTKTPKFKAVPRDRQADAYALRAHIRSIAALTGFTCQALLIAHY